MSASIFATFDRGVSISAPGESAAGEDDKLFMMGAARGISSYIAATMRSEVG